MVVARIRLPQETSRTPRTRAQNSGGAGDPGAGQTGAARQRVPWRDPL